MTMEYVIRVAGRVRQIRKINQNGTIELEGNDFLIHDGQNVGRLVTQGHRGRFQSRRVKVD